MKSSGGAVLLCLDFLTILEGETDIVGTVDGGIFDKAVPAVNAELFQGVRQLLEGLEEGFVFGSLQVALKMRIITSNLLSSLKNFVRKTIEPIPKV